MPEKYEKLYGHAHNLVAAYKNLEGLRNLFEEAMNAEKFTIESKGVLVGLEDEIKALNETKNALHLRCGEDAEKIKEQKIVAEKEIFDMAEKYTKRYEAEHGKMVKEAEAKVLGSEEQLKKLDKEISAKETVRQHLDEQIEMKNSQVGALNTQFDKIRDALKEGG